MPLQGAKASYTRVTQRLKRNARAQGYAVWPSLVSWILAVAAIAILIALYFDPAISEWRLASGRRLARWSSAVTDVGLSQWYLVPAGVIVLYLGALRWDDSAHRWRRRSMTTYTAAAFIFASVAGAGIFTNIAKQLVGRGRPRTFEEFGAYAFKPFEFDYLYQSFPSGHSTTCGSLAMLLMLFYPKIWWVWLSGMFAIALTRVGVGAHYLSDVIAGFTVGSVITLVLARWLASRRIMFHPVNGRLLPKIVWR